MKKALAILLAVLTISGIGAVGASATDAIEVTEVVLQEDTDVSVEEKVSAEWTWLEDILSWNSEDESETDYKIIEIARWVLRTLIVLPFTKLTSSGRWLWRKIFW